MEIHAPADLSAEHDWRCIGTAQCCCGVSGPRAWWMTPWPDRPSADDVLNTWRHMRAQRAERELAEKLSRP